MPTIIFDLDGTLVDLWPIERMTLLAMLLRLTGSKEKSLTTKLNVLKKSQSDLFKVFNHLFANYSERQISKQRFIKLYDEIQRSLIKTKTYPNITKHIDTECLVNLGNKYTLSLVTGSRAQELNYVLKTTNFINLFRKPLVICSDTMEEPKSTGMPFKAISKENPGQIVVIGDSDSDKLGAQKAEVPYIIIKKGKNVKDAIKEAQKSFENCN